MGNNHAALKGPSSAVSPTLALITDSYKVHEQMSVALDRGSTQVWIVNVGDLKPYEREIEFFLGYGWNATRWTSNNLDDFVTAWAQRDFGVSNTVAKSVSGIVANLTRFNARRKPEMWNGTTYSLINYREWVFPVLWLRDLN